MILATESTTTQQLSLPEELILMLLNEESGYFHQVPGWKLNCTVIGAVLAELSLAGRIDTDLETLIPLDKTEVGDPILDPILKEIADEPVQRNAQFWIERLAPRAESIVDLTLDRLVEMGILDHHDGGFWTLSQTVGRRDLVSGNGDDTATEFVTSRIRNVILYNEIPFPRDAVIISLLNTCDVLRFMFQLDENLEKRIEAISRIDLIGRAIGEAVSYNLAGPLLRHSALTKRIPTVPLRKVLLNSHVREGNVAALFGQLAEEYGPVFEIRPPFQKPMIVLAGPETNGWVQRSGRMYLRAKDYFSDFEKVYGASGVMPSLDGADHFRIRKSMSSGYSRKRLMGQLDQLYSHTRNYMADWRVGETYPATRMSRLMINAQLSPLLVSVESQDIFDDLAQYKERALLVHIVKMLPKFMLKTPGMKRKAKAVDTLLERIQGVHTPAQRAGSPRDLADDWLSLHASDPQFVPETSLRFQLAAALIASVYLGDAFSFTLYAMASQPDLYAKIQSEADALFHNGDPKGEEFAPPAIDVTHRFLMECLRMYPIVPISIRNVMNTCVVENYELPVGSRIYIAQAAAHFMDDVFPDPFTFDIDRYLPPRNEHRSQGYAPYGLGTHMCLGSRWVELQLAVNVLMVAHYFNLKVSPKNYRLKFSALPSTKPNKKLKFHVAEQRHELPA